MSTTLRIDWTTPAREDLAHIISNLEDYYSPEVAARFTRDMYQTERNISQNPRMYARAKENPKIRRAVLSDGKIAAYYKLFTDRAEILFLTSTRQNPGQITRRIEDS